jgi:hypothetical protein
MIEQAQEPPPLSSAELEATVTRLGCKDEVTRAEAERVMQQSGVSAIEPLVAILTRELAAHRKRQWMGLAGMFSFGLGSMAALHFGLIYDVRLLLIGVAVGMVGMMLLADTMQPSRLQKNTAAMLLTIDDLRAIGPLLDIRRTYTAESRKVRWPLHCMLHRLRASHSVLIDERHRDHFRSVLKYWQQYQRHRFYGTDYIIAILTALQQIGGARDLPYVERIAYPDRAHHTADAGLCSMRKRDSSAQDWMRGRQMQELDKSRIMQAAQQCLPYLQMNAEQQRVSNSLLRASDSSTGTSDILLRPAGSGATSGQYVLLRASPTTETERFQ